MQRGIDLKRGQEKGGEKDGGWKIVGRKREERLFWHDQANADGVADQAGDVMDVQPLHQLPAVGLHGLDAHSEDLGNLARGVPFRN